MSSDIPKMQTVNDRTSPWGSRENIPWKILTSSNLTSSPLLNGLTRLRQSWHRARNPESTSEMLFLLNSNTTSPQPQYVVRKNNNNSSNSATTTTIMSSSSVWVQLYYEGKNEPKGRPVEIEPIPRNINALAEEVKVTRPNALSHCDAADLSVYPPDTKPPFSQANSIRPGKKLEEVIQELKKNTPPTSDDHPFIVAAPAPPQKPANGKKSSRFGSFVCC